MQILKPKEIIEEISNLKTGEKYKNDEEWKAKGIPESDIRRDVRVIMPSLDLFGETKQNGTMAITRAQQYRQMLKEGSKPVEQAGVMNYMPSEMITVPKVAKSSPDTPTAKLAYITPKEQDILIDLNLYGSFI